MDITEQLVIPLLRRLIARLIILRLPGLTWIIVYKGLFANIQLVISGSRLLFPQVLMLLISISWSAFSSCSRRWLSTPWSCCCSRSAASPGGQLTRASWPCSRTPPRPPPRGPPPTGQGRVPAQARAASNKQPETRKCRWDSDYNISHSANSWVVRNDVTCSVNILLLNLKLNFPKFSAHRARPYGKEAGARGQHRRLGHVDLSARFCGVQRCVLGLLQTRGRRALQILLRELHV